MHVVGDVTTRTAGQHARAAVVRLRLRALLTLGVLAVATAALGRIFGLQDLRFLFAELALLASMFVISRYVLPLVDRRDRGASAEEHVGSLLDALDAITEARLREIELLRRAQDLDRLDEAARGERRLGGGGQARGDGSIFHEG